MCKYHNGEKKSPGGAFEIADAELAKRFSSPGGTWENPCRIEMKMYDL
jgi:hypothetical protein